jgi:hypothetical protein
MASGWSQDEIASEVGQSREWVKYHLRFGRFITFFSTVRAKDDSTGPLFVLPANLTENRFRAFWEATKPAGNFTGHRANTEAAAADEHRRFCPAVRGVGLVA